MKKLGEHMAGFFILEKFKADGTIRPLPKGKIRLVHRRLFYFRRW